MGSKGLHRRVESRSVMDPARSFWMFCLEGLEHFKQSICAHMKLSETLSEKPRPRSRDWQIEQNCPSLVLNTKVMYSTYHDRK